MRIFLVLMTAFIFISACEQENLVEADGGGDIFKEKPQPSTDKTKIVGLWESNGYFDGNMTQKIRIRFDEDQEKVIRGSECRYVDGASLYAQVEAPAVYKDNVANVTAADQDYETKQNGKIKYECFASLAPTQFKIGLNGKINIEGFALSKIAD